MTKSATDWIDGTAKTQMKRFYATLSEKDQRRFAALEARRHQVYSGAPWLLYEDH